MTIHTMTATFGKLEHQTLALRPGLNIIQAPNEWGKSTWCAFLLAMLYGIDSRAHSTTKSALADKTRYDPWSGQLMSGRIELEWNGREITIERSSTKRSIFRQFRAYETVSGLVVPELTADNCGQRLLGVEKEVFQRAGFLRLTDLPVTDNDALRRRLSDLVTTGDETDAAHRLSSQLSKLKNECRANRSKGRLPQAQAQQTQLTQRLQELDRLQDEHADLNRQLQQEQTRHSLLNNHLTALDWAQNQQLQQRLAQAEQTRDQAARQVQTQEAVCRSLPDSATIDARLTRLRQLRTAQDEAAAMCPPPPPAVEIPPFCQGLTEADAARRAQADAEVFQQALRKKKSWTWAIAGSCFALAGAAFWLILHWIGQWVGAAAIVMGLVSWYIHLTNRRIATATARALSEKYPGLPPERWVAAITEGVRQQSQYASSLAQYQANQLALEKQAEQVRQDILALTGGQPPAQWEQALLDAQRAHSDLIQARQAYARAAELTQALSVSSQTAVPPSVPDSLTHSREDTLRLLSDCTDRQQQLRLRLGRCQGQMDALGDRARLVSDLDAVTTRIRQLEDHLAALTLAQETLAAATAQLQQRFAPRITRQAQALFSRLTGGRYDRLILSQDLRLFSGARDEDTLRTILWRSDGTVDQLYLALRLAVARDLTPGAPLVLDDALVRFDDTRLKAAMEILQEEAQSRQVILFTCQDRESRYIN